MLRRPNPATVLLALVPLAWAVGCAGDRVTGDRANTLNLTLAVTPQTPGIVAGQSIPFQSTLPWSGGTTLWSVVPASAGTISASGVLTAASTDTPGQTFTVLAVWSQDVRYTASTRVNVLWPPAPAETTPDLVEVTGAMQTVPGTGISNGAVVGEPVPATASVSANGLIQNRGDFMPPGPAAAN